MGWSERKESRDRKGRREERMVEEDGRRETLRGELQSGRRRIRRMMVRWVEGRVWGVAAEVESLWTAACFPSPCKDWITALHNAYIVK